MTSQKTLTPAAKADLQIVLNDYKKVRPPTDNRPSAISVDLEPAVVAFCKAELDQARSDFDALQWSKAAEQYRRIRELAECAVQADKESSSVIVSAIIGEAACLLNQQKVEAARDLLERLDGRPLDSRQRTALARALVELKQTKRARTVLNEAPSDDRSSERWIEASIIVDLAEDILPKGSTQTPSILDKLAYYHLVHGQVGEASKCAMLGLAGTENPVLQVNLLLQAMTALLRTVYEDDLGDQGVPVAERTGYARQISSHYQRLSRCVLPQPVRRSLLGLGLTYAAQLREVSLHQWIRANNDSRSIAEAERSELKPALEAAKNGDIATALTLVPTQKHPWRSSLVRANLRAAAGDVALAVQELRTLATDWPHSVPIRTLLAELLFTQGDFVGARSHADAAYDGFPTDDMALLYARCLVEAGDGVRALAVVKELPASAEVWELRAYAADLAQDSEAASYWSRLLELDSSSNNTRLRLAAALARNGDYEGAARRAGELLDDAADSLSSNALIVCAQLLSMARFLPTSENLILRATETLKQRFPEDAEAEFQRFHFLARLGFPDGAVPIDYERLEKAGKIQSFHVDEAPELFQQRADLVSAAYNLYSGGFISIYTFCEVTGQKVAALTVALSDSLQPSASFRAAVLPTYGTSELSITGRDFLCSSLELLLLQHCDALVHVPVAIGGGSLIALDSTWERMVNDAYQLEHGTQRGELARLTALLANVPSAEIQMVPQVVSESETANQRSCTYVAITPNSESAGALAFLHWLANEGAISRTKLNSSARYLASAATTPTQKFNAKAPILLENGLLELWHQAGVLDEVVAALPTVYVTDVALEQLRRRRGDLDVACRAADLQRATVEALRSGRAAGWFRVVSSPPSEATPPPRTAGNAQQAELLTRSIRDHARVKDLLRQNPTWTRVAADSFGVDTIGHSLQWKLFDFKDAEESTSFLRKYWTPGKQDVTLSRFARAVFGAPQRFIVVQKLALFGFKDAMSPEDLVRLFHEYGRVDAQYVGRILTAIEEGVEESLTRGVFSRRQLAELYAETIWSMVVQPSEPIAGVPLLGRLERIDSHCSTRLVEDALCRLLVSALDRREASFVAEQPGASSRVTESQAGTLWQQLFAWKSASLLRKPAFRRALSQAWQLLGDVQDGPVNEAQWAPLALAQDVLLQDEHNDFEVPSPDAAVGILSALWQQRPLQKKSVLFLSTSGKMEADLETIMKAAAKAVPEQMEAAIADNWCEAANVSFDYHPEGTEEGIRIVVPAEAALLRMEPQAASEFARGLANMNGFRDGRLYHALMEFAKSPTSHAQRKYLARAACGSPFRLVADDPRFLLTFGDGALAARHGYPMNLGELREMLSESGELFHHAEVTASSLIETLRERIQEGGSWSDRVDRIELVRFASLVPGRLPAWIAFSTFDHDEDLVSLSQILSHSGTLSIGTLCAAVATAAIASDGLHGEEQRAGCLGALAAALRCEFSPTDEICLASVELAAIEAVRKVVRRFSPWGMSDIEHAWLTTRLYEWWTFAAGPQGICALFEAPAHRDLQWRRVRTEAVLNTILDVLERKLVINKVPPSLPGAIVDSLKTIADNDANPFEPANFLKGWIYWSRPQGCGWLASRLLLWASPELFFELRNELRLALIEKGLPRENTAAGEHRLAYLPVVLALHRGAEKLSQAEHDALHTWCDEAEHGDVLDLWRMYLLSGLLASRQDRRAAERLRDLVTSEFVSVARDVLVKLYFEAVATASLEDMESALVDVMRAVLCLQDGGEAIQHGLEQAMRGDLKDRVLDIVRRLQNAPDIDGALLFALESVLQRLQKPSPGEGAGPNAGDERPGESMGEGGLSEL